MREPDLREEAAEARARPVGGAAHTLAFLALAIALAWGVSAGPRLGVRLIGPEPMPELRHLSIDETIASLADRSAPQPDIKRAVIEQVTGLELGAMDDLAVTDLFARYQQFARDLAEVRDGLARVIYAVVAGLFAIAAGRVAYRARDALLLLVPVVQLGFGAKILWRLTSPRPYWAEAPPREGISVLGGFALGVLGAFAVYMLIGSIQSI